MGKVITKTAKNKNTTTNKRSVTRVKKERARQIDAKLSRTLRKRMSFWEPIIES